MAAVRLFGVSGVRDDLDTHSPSSIALEPIAISYLPGGSRALVTPLTLVALIGVHLNWEIIKRSVLDVSPLGSEIQS